MVPLFKLSVDATKGREVGRHSIQKTRLSLLISRWQRLDEDITGAVDLTIDNYISSGQPV